MEKFLNLLPIFLTIFLVGLLVAFFSVNGYKKFLKKYPLFYDRKWIAKNRMLFLKNELLFRLPGFLIAAGFIEEIIFRAPLLVFFDSISPGIWKWTIFSSFLFGLMHFRKHYKAIRKIPATVDAIKKQQDEINKKLAKAGNSLTFRDPEIELKENIRKRKRAFWGGIIHIFNTFIMGIFLAYLCIKYQSILMPVIVHGLWNACVFFIEICGRLFKKD